MNETTPATPPSADQPVRSWRRLLGMALFLAILAVIGLGLTDWAPKKAAYYWVITLPIFGLLCVRMGVHTGHGGQDFWPALKMQTLHWVGFLLALLLLFLLINVGKVSPEAGGLLALVLLFQSSYYAGVHFQRAFLLVALLLLLAVPATAYIEDYLWVALAFLGAAAGFLLLRRPAAPPSPSGPPPRRP